MKPTFASLIVALLLPIAAVAQEAPAGRITVTGEGSVSAAPDMALITLGVTTEGETAKAALDLNNEQQAAVMASLSAAGVEGRDIQTSVLNLSPVWRNDRAGTDEEPRISGYQASNQVTVRVRDLAALGALLDTVVTTGANTLNSLSFSLSDPAPEMDKARRAAVADAMARAKLYAEAAGVTLGPVIRISDAPAQGPVGPMFRQAAEMKAVPVAAGEIALSASVTVTFAISQ